MKNLLFFGLKGIIESILRWLISKNVSRYFPIFSKIKVNGPEAHPLFKLLKSDKPGIFRTQSIKWNFTKFLIDSNGKIVERFSPRVEPKYIRKEIEKIL